jgi:ABC-type multidrug transport system fused ATPase/permease subunit
VKPQNRLEIKPPINGKIEKIFVKEGDKVKTGELLATISSTERTALLDTALMQDSGTVKYWQGIYNTTPILAPIDGVVIVKAVEPGQTVAILGATGSGKSSLVNLIPRFYDVTEGSISIDDVDVRDVTIESLRSNIGIALQDSVLFSGTIRET